MIALKKHIIDEEATINDDLFNKYFKIQRPSNMFPLLNKTNDPKKNNKLVNLINSGLTDINEELFKKYFNHQRPSDMLKHLNKTNENNKLVNVINNGLKDFKEQTKKMSKEEK